MTCRSIRSVAIAFATIVGTAQLCAATCVYHPENVFQLASDTVYWSFVVNSDAECVQGLRARTMLLHEVSVAEPPRAGSLTISGPSFRYRAPVRAGTDTFKLEVVGENLRVRGKSVIVVHVLIQ